MRILHRYLRREVALQAGVGLLLFTFVLFMQDLGRALEATVRVSPWALVEIFADVLPAALVFTLPLSLLVGILIGLGRLGVDNELMGMSAAGVSRRRLSTPLLQVTGAALALALVMSLWLAPAAARHLSLLQRQLATADAASEVQPRVFFEPANNPDWVIYTGGLGTGGQSWRQVMVANVKDPAQPEITMASAGWLVHRPASAGTDTEQMQLHLVDGSQYKLTLGHPDDILVSAFRSFDIPFLIPAARAPSANADLSLRELWRAAGPGSDRRAAEIELQRRFALALACVALGWLGIPLGLRGGRGGKSGGFILTLLLVLGYYLVFILGLGFAKQGVVPVWLGVWGADLACWGLGLWCWLRLDRLPQRPVAGTDPVAWIRAWLSRRVTDPAAAAKPQVSRGWMPSLLEGYILREFVGYAGLMLAAFLVLVLVFTLFELVGSILQNHIGLTTIGAYLLNFSPQMIYMMMPVAVLLGVLITFGLMSKSNEITALKASGVSVYRLLAPVLFAGCILCAGQFALDATWLPGFNQRQDELHAEIKGQPAQTFHNPEHKWVFGQHNEVYYFAFFDPIRNEFADVSVFEYDPQAFRLTRRIFARDGRWDSQIQNWVFSDGWMRDFHGAGETGFQRFQVASFAELPERPAYFNTGSRLGTQMTYGALRRYIRALQASGYDVARLSVTLSKKIAYPLITVVMALLAFPFALTVGRRGTIAGVTAGIAVALMYWTTSSLLETLGNLNQLPAPIAAWAPDTVFFGLGLYLLLRVRT